MAAQSSQSRSQPAAPVPLEYGRPGNSQPLARLRYSLDRLCSPLGGVGQVAFALGAGAFAGGLGLCIEASHDFTGGPILMALGAAVMGLLIPIPVRRSDRR